MRNTPRNQEQDVLQGIAQLDYKVNQAINARPSVPVHYVDPDTDTIPAGYQWLLVSDPATGATTPSVHKVFDGKKIIILSQSDHTHASGYRARCELGRSAAWTHSSGSPGAFLGIPWDVEIIDTDNMHSVVSNTDRIQAPFTAWYDAGFQFNWASNATGRRISALYKGTSFAAQGDELFRHEAAIPGAGSNATCGMSRIVKLTAGDIIRVGAFQSSGGNLDVTHPGGNAYTPFFHCHQVSDAE